MQRGKSDIALLLVIAGTLSQCSPPNEQISNVDREQYLQAHGNDPIALDKEFGSEAQAACSTRVDEYLRSISRYDFAWDDDAKGWNGIKFDKVPFKSTGFGMLTLMSTRAKLSNGFGAFEHRDIYCLYNVASKNFVRFETYDPALDLKTSQDDTFNSRPNDDNKSTIVIHDANDTEAQPPADNTTPIRPSEPDPEESLTLARPQE